LYVSQLPAALHSGVVQPPAVDLAVSRMLKKMFHLGLFDPVSSVPYASFGVEKLDAGATNAVALDTAKQGIVLLQNEKVGPKPLLPLSPKAKVAILGPHYNASTDMLSQYRGDNRVVYQHTPLLAMTKRGNVVASAKGSGLWDQDESGFAAAVEAAGKADVAVVMLGLHPQWFDNPGDGDAQEGEDNDRANITLPVVQLKLLKRIVQTGVPTVVVLINGGQVACPWVKANIPAVVEAFYPGQFGGTALATILYGDDSPSGRLPYTMYGERSPQHPTTPTHPRRTPNHSLPVCADADFVARRPDIGDMSLSNSGGITYQYYRGAPLWPFGFGLSYSSFSMAWVSAASLSASKATVGNGTLMYVVWVENTGGVASDVTVLAFLRHRATAAPQPRPLRQLCAFCRVSNLQPQDGRNCTLTVAASVVARGGVVFAGDYEVAVEFGDGTGLSGALEVAS
jgi:hypothetical protein